MRRKLLSLLLVLATVCTVFAGTAFAESQLNHVTDQAGLLTTEEISRLEQMAKDVSTVYGIGVYVITVDDYRNYGSGNVYETTYGIYHQYTLGEGEDRDGILLLLSMNERDFATFSYGEKSEYVFDDYILEQLENFFLDNFGENDWYGGFRDYIKACSAYLEKSSSGEPVRESNTAPIGLIAALSLFLSFLVVAFLWTRMTKVSKKGDANLYCAGKLNLTGKSDTFTYRTETRRKIESSSSSGGGSHSHSGGGGHGKSGKF